jgi:hypothetical protein
MNLAKVFLLIAATLTVGSKAFADPTIGSIYSAGLVRIEALELRGVQIPLNPIICLNDRATGAGEALIYSHDFRHDGTVFVTKGSNLTKVSKDEAQIVELATPRVDDGMILQTRITFQGRPFTCESSLLQLETVGG